MVDNPADDVLSEDTNEIDFGDEQDLDAGGEIDWGTLDTPTGDETANIDWDVGEVRSF